MKTHLVKISSILAILFLLATPSALFAQPMTVNDTTRIDCGTTADYNLWIDNKQLALAFQFPGSRLEATPPITTNFTFDTPCNDTVTHLLELFDGTNTLLYSEQAVLIVKDDEAPVFMSSLPDTIFLSCNDVIPDSSTVLRSDNCQIDQFMYTEESNAPGNCPVADTIRRNWTAVDLCGNQASYQQTIIINDDQRPVFLDLPPLNDTVGCLADAHPDFTGYPVAEDNCDTDVEINFSDQLTNESQLTGCQNQQRIIRIWTIRDDCSNTNTYVQTIRVIDTIPPSFIAPKDTVISCEFGDDPFFTGTPIFEQTDCDSLTENNYRFEDRIIASDCDNTYRVLRKWFVFDNCGNTDSVEQNIEVIDTIPPTFQRSAQDLILNCPNGQLLDTVYQNWIDDNGLALASDNCNADGDISWQALVSGTSTPATFPTRSCQDGDQIILEQTVDFIATDLCGNQDTTTASFRVVDDVAPQIISCPTDTTIFTRTDACLGSFRLFRPSVQDECSADGTSFPGLLIEYQIGTGAFVTLSGTFVDLDVPLGQQLITYRVTDCGGNQTSCSFQVTVEDNVPPQIICPADTLLEVGPNDCQVALELPLPQASDNCSLDPTFEGPRPIYFASGATTIIPQKMDAGPAPTENFNLGVTIVSYVIRDQAGNTDTCSFQVTVEDNIAPIASCQPTTIFINPSGLDNQSVPVGDVNNNSMDNCAIDTMFITPNIFSCEAQVGGVESIVLTVIDESNNIARCTTFVRIENLEPQPSANSGLCGNDTLFLSANPPPADGGTVYTYRWSGPNGFTSTRGNPEIPNIREINAGSYTVTITGLTGCTSIGSVEVTIEDLPQTPTLIAEDNYCINSFVNLQSSIAPDGAQVIYRWYRGTPPGGTLIAETIVPSFSFQAASVQSSDEYYVVVEADGCISQPSLPKRITINDFPVAIPEETTITVCSGESIRLGTQVIGNGITYQWTGPNGYNETGQFPRIIESAITSNDGIYSLVVSRNGCPSSPAFVRVNVLQSPSQPMLSNNGPVCEEESITLSTNAQASIYHWIAPDLTEFSTTTNTFMLNNVSKNVNGEWRLYVTDFNCDSPTSVPTSVIVNDLPNAVAASSPDIVCEGSDLQLNASPNIADATYAWSGPDNFSGVGRNVSINNIRPAKSGNYQVTITTTQGCSNSADINVTVQESVRIIAATNDGPACLSGATDIRLNAAVFPADDG
ncbi:MAG: HYR domain-containing protein, partial [Bacteroidota bacterium]